MTNISVVLRHIFEAAPEVSTAFVHGSFVDGSFTNKNFRDVRVFSRNEFQCSLFHLTDIDHDIDVVCVSEAPHITNAVIRNQLTGHITDFFLTINIVSRRVFEDQVTSASPTAIKRIVALKECNILIGDKYFFDQRRIALSSIRQADRRFQHEFSDRKLYLRSLIANNKKIHLLSASDYSQRFPLFLEFICGRLEAGFPEERIKVVLPNDMNLKFRLDIDLGRIVALS